MKSSSQLTSTIFTEVFPVQTKNLPNLYAYRLDIGGNNASSIGGKLSYRLRNAFRDTGSGQINAL